MFTLRRISSDGVQMNHYLGKNYTLVGRIESYENFCRDFKAVFNTDHVADLDPESTDSTKRVVAFVSNEDGSDIYPLYGNQQNYIMEGGRTVDRLNFMSRN